ncbi:MAG: hypothetical protein ACTSXD_12410 [Candidatus Heimdallarchaeaceae archaeon]
MEEIYHSEGPKSNMLLWNTYFRTMYVEPKRTETGEHSSCVMLTIGRRIKSAEEIDRKAVETLPKRVRDQILTKYSSETLKKAPLTLKDKFQNAVLESINKINRTILKTIGITMIKEAGNVEIFEYLKLRKVEDILPIIYGSFMALGVLCYMNDLNLKEILDLRRKLELKLGKFLMLGYDRAKKKNWK